MFTFLGVFASPPRNMAREFAGLWPDADFAKIKKPFKAAAVRLTKEVATSSEEELPPHITEAVIVLSTRRPQARFMALRADCWGGICTYTGQVIEGGQVLAEQSGQQALRPLIRHFGVDMGERQTFLPLARNFPWAPLKRPASGWFKFLGL